MYERILVALDGSALSERVLPDIEVLAGRLGATVLLIRVIAPLPSSSAAAPTVSRPRFISWTSRQQELTSTWSPIGYGRRAARSKSTCRPEGGRGNHHRGCFTGCRHERHRRLRGRRSWHLGALVMRFVGNAR